MGYLDNSIVTVDAILTKKGRELLARGDGSFKITQFAVSDDEIDYTLYNPTHPQGSQYDLCHLDVSSSDDYTGSSIHSHNTFHSNLIGIHICP